MAEPHEKELTLSIIEFIDSAPNINRACSSLLENSSSIFLPIKRIDNSDVAKRFFKNNQVLEIEHNLFGKLQVRGRLLGQIHKDILEVLLTGEKRFNKNNRRFSVEMSAYQILKRLGVATTNKKWLSEKINEIAECRIRVFSTDGDVDQDFSFGFIDTVSGLSVKCKDGESKDIDEKIIKVVFSEAYTAFLARTEILDYSNYIDDIVSLDNTFIKAVVRYMLINNGRDSRIKISNLIEKLQTDKIMSHIELKRNIKLLKSRETQELLRERFGITIVGEETLVFNELESKSHYYIKPLLVSE
jgi:hypothetical protein